MNYKEMSDFEINLAAAKARYHQVEFIAEKEWVAVMGSGYRFDPCSNPLDAWPIILDNGISINKWDKSDSFWTADVERPKACDEYNTIEVKHENPLRAAMICFLLMKDAENDNRSTE